MSEAVINRLIQIVEHGTYGTSGTTSLNAKALRYLVGSIDPISGVAVMILPRGNNGWRRESSGHWQTDETYELSYYVQNIAEQNEVKGIADATNLERLATRIFLSRPQLQLFYVTALAAPDEVVGEISLQTISNLNLPIPYPPNATPTQGASLHWGFIHRITVTEREYIAYLPQG
jgi:hypothetical protein